MKKGICKHKIKFLSLITVTDKGQIAIPIDLRNDCDIKKGDKLIIVKRDDGKGFNLLKMDIIGDLIEKISKD